MRYAPSLSASSRDLRLDLLRGLCLVKMVLEHLLPSPLRQVGDWLGFVTAAEGFFFISGAVLGIVYRRRLSQQGLKSSSFALWERAAQLYIANLAFVFLFLSLELSQILPLNLFATDGGSSLSWSQVFSLDQPYYLHVLPRYVVFLAAAPIALFFLHRGWTAMVLALSVGIHGIHWIIGPNFHLPWLETPEAHFPSASWQLLFFVGMILGWHRPKVAQSFGRIKGSPWALAFLCLGFLFFALLRGASVQGWTSLGPHLPFWLDRQTLSYLRWVNLAIAFTFFFWIADRFWIPISRGAGWFLLPIGQNALYVFLLHIPIAFALAYGIAPSLLRGLSDEALLVTRSVLNLAALAILWLLVRQRVLFRWIPR
ncbi:MAG: OpgC domain-containing protein [Acidobacteriota bacterium]